jgi:hypothetical protein
MVITGIASYKKHDTISFRNEFKKRKLKLPFSLRVLIITVFYVSLANEARTRKSAE